MEVLPYLYYEFHHGTLEEGKFPIVDSLLPENGNSEFEFPGDCHHHAVSSFSAKRQRSLQRAASMISPISRREGLRA